MNKFNNFTNTFFKLEMDQVREDTCKNIFTLYLQVWTLVQKILTTIS